MGGELDGGGGLGEGKLVGEEPAGIELAREDQAGHFGLEPEVRRVAPDQVLLVHTYRGEIKGCLIAAPGVGEEQHLSGAADQRLGLAHDGVRRHGDDRGVQAAPGRQTRHELSQGGGRGSIGHRWHRWHR